jgi:RHS repeat-associated protein
VWQWSQEEPFGNHWANENPGGAGIFDMPLRFPGQYFDGETGLHYNYYRDFDAGIGAYKESDPIGLRGGLNTYSYGGSDPLRYADEFGLAPACQADDCRIVIEFTWRYSGYCGSPCIASSGYLQYWNCAPRFRYKEARCDCSNIWRLPKG